MVSRQDWLAAGLEILAEDGAPALTLDRLTTRLALTKGSFYHHFEGMPHYRKALLEHFEAERTTSLIETVERDADEPPGDRLTRLLDLILDRRPDESGPDLEVAVRAWAQQDREVRDAQQRIDDKRVDYVRGLWREATGDDDLALRMARLQYFVLIGAGHVAPRVAPDELRRMYALTMDRLPVEG